MKSLSRIFFLICTFIVIVAFIKKEEKFTIYGQVTGFQNGTKFYLKNLATDAIIDSTTVENNKFRFEGKLASPPEQIWLYAIVNEKFIYTNLLIGNDNIRIKGDIKDFPRNVEIKGSKSQEDFNYSQSFTKEYFAKRETLVNSFLQLPKDKQQEAGAKIWDEIKGIDSITQELRIKYVKSHPDSYASIIELGYLKNQLPKDTIQKIYDKYTPKIKESKYAKVVEVFLKENISKVGDKYHDFEGWNQKGEKVKFSDIRGSFTLIEFTSAFCGPCIQAAEELAEINETYSGSLTLVSFSCDPKKEDWLKSVDRDKVIWNSVWDSKGRFSETAIKYGIQGIPTFILINPEGTIIDKWSGYGKGSLINKLEKKILKK
ncbi:TlpA disulfide reductase family protein [Flavobacterium ginsenosidimutans]|uniref:TlpA disulfide reductase family protein n=1 Tax=Flavobacterium ginsenosidimutans TaxID=687844 RepID=A0ABZ2QA63_9FLAO|nr:TlpA disulfide reductase family protein [Flavobacterium ginsenosidimutans]KAF2338817.1 AhpC/TSA family protein [Flavobacterium ginsenosidimutans]